MNSKERQDLLTQLRDMHHKMQICCGTGCDKPAVLAQLQALIVKYDLEAPVVIEVDWNTAPPWARYWGLDFDGVSTWFERKPVPFGGRWCVKYGGGRHATGKKYDSKFENWQTTLRNRKVA